MKHLFTVIVAIAISIGAFAQTKFPAIDQSPMDMSYYPVNYPILKIQDKLTEPLVARVIYSRPQSNGRGVFGELVEYEKVWRLGANEASEIEFFQNVIFNGKAVAKGKYTLYAIPTLTEWTVILNSETDTWGSFKYDIKKDVVRVEVPSQQLPEPTNILSVYFEKSPAGFNLIAAWEKSMITVPITVNVKAAGTKVTAKPVKKK